ncbi:hypothetical protein ACFRFH_01910 [Leifsonia sp. NPDC056824]|uniref:hypothetical protein n=1 Tax=Leifsonia sp. NPDC056824 TaxID=3345953 RepID=UPI0036A92E0F
MDKQRLVIAGVGLAIAVVIGLGYLLGVQPQLTAAATAADQAAQISTTNHATEVQLNQLKKDYADIDQFKGQLADLQESIPSTRSLDSFVSDLHALAAQTGETISGVNPSDPVAYTPPAAPAAPTPSSTSTASPSPTPTPTPAAPAAPTAPQAPKATTNSLITSSNFVAIPMTITVKGSTDGAIAFLGALQHGKRLMLVTGFSGNESKATPTGAAAAAAVSQVDYTIKGLVYVLSTAPTPAPTPSK